MKKSTNKGLESLEAAFVMKHGLASITGGTTTKDDLIDALLKQNQQNQQSTQGQQGSGDPTDPTDPTNGGGGTAPTCVAEGC